MIVDFQHHYVPYELATRHGVAGRGRIEVRDGAAPKVTLHEKLYDLEIQLADMDQMGIDVAVLSCFIAWDASPEDCHFVNQKMAEAQARSKRFACLAHIPAHDPKAAVKELKHAITDLGLHGLAVTSQIMGKPLDETTLREIRRHVGLVFQDPDDQLFCPTVFEDVAFGPLNLSISPQEIFSAASYVQR